MKSRPSSRILLLDSLNRILLFRLVFRDGALAGQQFWATPGGALEPGETFEQAARRELHEETGWEVSLAEIGVPLAVREFPLLLPDGESVLAIEKYFFVRFDSAGDLLADYRTDEELSVLAEHKWWHVGELEYASEKIYPEDIAEMLEPLISS